jgi:hypothetical protein
VGDIAFLEVRSILVTEDGSPGGVFGTDDRHISGTLRRIDNRDRTLIVETNDRAREAVVSFDGRTRVLYDDRNIAISELREFDELEIELVPNSGLAETITVVDSEYASDAGDDFATARGEVVFVDEDRRELVITRDDRFRSSLDSGSSFDSRNSFDTRDDQRATFRYERDVIVEFQGDFYGPSSLERGDGVEIDYERIGEDLWAERIVVTHNGRQ